jgi:uncharacterized protein (TIGR02271 family)
MPTPPEEQVSATTETKKLVNPRRRLPRAAPMDDAASRSGRAVLPVVREELVVGKRRVEKGTVHVQKRVRERVVVVEAPLVREEATVERVPIGRLVDGPRPVRREGDTLVLPVVEEVFVKRLRLIEEIRITKRQTVARRAVKVPLRREEVVVKRR